MRTTTCVASLFISPLLFKLRNILVGPMSSMSRLNTSGLNPARGPRGPTASSRYSSRSTRRPRTAATSTGYGDHELICAVCESRGISPTVGLSFVSTSTSEAVLCQITDTQTYARTCHKIKVFAPTEILYMSTAADSKLVSILVENIVGHDSDVELTVLDRKYWTENSGYEYIQHLALPEDLESLKVSLSGNYFALCCFSAVCS